MRCIPPWGSAVLDELLIQAKLAEWDRAVGHGTGRPGGAPPGDWRTVGSYQPVTERPRPDARRLLGRWLRTRRAARPHGVPVREQ